MKRCPKCNKNFPDDANFCPVDAGQLESIEEPSDGVPAVVAKVDTGGHELLAGRFALGDIISGHRTGPVYQARDKQGDTAIVKLVAPEVFSSSMIRQRCERELKQLERLEHPNVVKILGHGSRGDSLWIAMERVDGIPLGQFIENSGALPELRVTSFLKQLGAGLEAAAKLGVTHRDLSPKNILVADNHLQLINFGVALPTEHQVANGYWAPEQASGRPVDQRGNIYSLGAIGYLLLTGTAPEGEVETLDDGLGVSAELSEILLKALQTSSSKRFMTLRQLVGELETASGAEPVAKKGMEMDVKKTLMGIAPGALGALPTKPAAKPVADIEPGGTADLHPVGTPEPVEEPATTAPVVASVPEEVAASAPVAAAVPEVAAPVPVAAAVPEVAVVPKSASKGKKSGKNRKHTEEPLVIESTKDKDKDKGKFRETMWFKKGELDEVAAQVAAQSRPEEGASIKADSMEMDVRYNDDGSISDQDHERLSLQTGATMMMDAVQAVPRASNVSVSEEDLMSEITGGRNKKIAGVAVALAVLVLVVVLLLT